MKILNYTTNFPVGFISDPSIIYYWGGLVQNSTKEKTNLIIGEFCQVGGKITVWGNGKFKMGNYCYINRKTRIVAIESISIGNYCMIGQNVHIEDNNNHPLD